MFECNQQQDAHELLVTVLNTLKDIKMPVPVIRSIATNDVSTVKSHCEAENHNGAKKGNRKILESHSNPSNSSSSGSHMSNSFRFSPKSDYVKSSSKCTNAPSANLPGNLFGETLCGPIRHKN